MEKKFSEIINVIKQARVAALKAVNTALIDVYWSTGSYISNKLENAEWGESIVPELARYILQHEPDIKGFSAQNLWRMKQFYEAYKDAPKLSTVLRELSWSHNLTIFSRCKTIEERLFYLKLSKKEGYSVRELDRQISAGFFERTMLGKSSMPPTVKQTMKC
jgi:predicted nuclease of restriction endonuclease-like (RecB) superfamily